MRKTKKNKTSLGILFVLVAVVLSSVLYTMSYEDSGHKAYSQAKISTMEVAPEPQPTVTVDPVGENIYVTNGDTNVRTEPNTESHIIGTLQGGLPVSILSKTDDGWGYVREFKGWSNLGQLKPVDVNDVIGVLFLKGNTPQKYYSKPDLNSQSTTIDGYMTYEVRPYIYNNNFYKIGDNAYIEKDKVMIDYYEREYYNRAVKVPLSRGNIQRHNVPIQRNISLSITEPSGLTIDELHQMTEGTELSGIAPALKRIEDKHGVNAVFALSVAQLESGNGSSYLARNHNNLFGLMGNSGGMYFDTKSDCIEYFGELISEDYFDAGRTDVYSVGDRYCENPAWPGMISSMMQRNLSSIQ